MDFNMKCIFTIFEGLLKVLDLIVEKVEKFRSGVSNTLAANCSLDKFNYAASDYLKN
jgi:hypothetical protein